MFLVPTVSAWTGLQNAYCLNKVQLTRGEGQCLIATSVIDNATAVICCELLLYEWHRILSVVVSVTSLAMLQNTSSCQVLWITLLGISPENANSYQSMGNVGTVVFSKSWTSCGFCCYVIGTAVQDCWNVSVWSTVHPWVWLINNLWVSNDAIVFFVCMRMYECCVLSWWCGLFVDMHV